MKPSSPTAFLLIACFLLQACEKPDCGCVAPPLSSALVGKWAWVKTVTPSRTITPQTTGYARAFEHENDANGDYIAFYQNDSLYLKVKPTGLYQEDRRQLTLLQQYGQKYLKYYLDKQNDVSREMHTSELMSVYSERADTVHHYYSYAGR